MNEWHFGLVVMALVISMKLFCLAPTGCDALPTVTFPVSVADPENRCMMWSTVVDVCSP